MVDCLVYALVLIVLCLSCFCLQDLDQTLGECQALGKLTDLKAWTSNSEALSMPARLRGEEGTADRDAAASNRSTSN